MRKNNKKTENITDRKLINLRLSQIKFTTRLNAPDLEYKINNLKNLIELLEDDKFYNEKLGKQYLDNLKGENYNCVEEIKKDCLDLDINFQSDFKELTHNLRKIICNGNYQKAIEIGNKIGELYQKKDLIWFLIALSHDLNGDKEESIFYYKRSILLNESEVKYYYYLANVYIDIGDLENANKYISYALRLNSESVYALEAYAYILLNNNKYDNAISIFKELLDNSKNYQIINRVISIVYFLKGVNYSHKANDGYLYNIDKNDTYNMIACIEKAMEFDSSDKYFKNNIIKAKNSLKMCFDLKRIWLLLITSLFYILNIPFVKFGVIVLMFIIFISSFKMVCVLERFRITNEGTKLDNFCNKINKIFYYKR